MQVIDRKGCYFRRPVPVTVRGKKTYQIVKLVVIVTSYEFTSQNQEVNDNVVITGEVLADLSLSLSLSLSLPHAHAPA